MAFGGLYISISGINANKRALDTVSHNIANVNNPSYVRQSAIHATNGYVTTQVGGHEMGTGVHVEEIRQIRDEFIDVRFRRELGIYGYHYAKADILNEVEMIFNDLSDSGLQNVMNNFWSSWSELYKEPDSLTLRGLVHESAVAFTQTVNHIDMQLDNLQRNLNKEILNKVEEVNGLLKDISDLNGKIKMAEGGGPNIKANDFKDMRNEKLDKLSKLIPITYYEKNTGEIAVTLQGRDLVNGDYINPIDIKTDNRGYGYIHWKDTGDKIELGEKGELGGYIAVRDSIDVEYRVKLNALVSTIASEINTIHESGKDLEENTGTKFFVPTDGEITAGNIKVNPDLSNFNKIAVSKSGAKGDGEIIKDILQLREKGFKELENTTFDDFYRDLVDIIGIEGRKAKSIASNQAVLLKQIEDRKGSISSVSLDEEMTLMLQYQHSYIANSRVVNAIDEMMENIVNRMGVVGR
ncbi:flagellar hook-associated protein FlgK [Sporanaerobacter acetigenes]|uniref:Flagellar hook-associated protein 1 n=1 Tax=Sporanaerobacter acetigenes DSM 13106 TaxID=1123281 RepID=A0A1M5STN3_9FIRM|nr:flagellar hook-associated protein FlgK [Sporanaerobacter acetigenes]SHH41864.1 flagellar hook-associated protein 1 FlgK [Sporanaerobacter acetigenes DSM 13106]